jgi:hypothetical protein
VFVIPFYPLPARVLKEKMAKCGFKPAVHEAQKDLALNWKYDIVVGKKIGAP